ncbi:2869_t:CDS:10 [Entrophospora sp. SA101]|nr:2869_t:CDS:10 [Entrophospora sp. SA101]
MSSYKNQFNENSTLEHPVKVGSSTSVNDVKDIEINDETTSLLPRQQGIELVKKKKFFRRNNIIKAGLVIIIGDVLAALGTFLFGKYIFSDWVVTQVEKRPMFKALNAVIAEEGWKIVVMLRLTPLPFNLISYFFSVSSINVSNNDDGNGDDGDDGTFNAVWIGSLVKSLSGIDKPNLEKKDIVIITMNFIIAACCVIALSILGKRSLRKAMVKLEASRDTEDDQGNPPINVPKSNIVVDEESILNSRAGKFTFIEKIVLTVIITIAFLNSRFSQPNSSRKYKHSRQKNFPTKDRAILDLKVQRDKLKQYQKKIKVVADKETEIAKKALSQGNKRTALLALRKKKYQQQLLEKTDTQLFNLEELTQSIEFALVEKDVFAGLEKGNSILKEIHKEISIEKVEKLMEETEDAISYQNEIEELLIPDTQLPTVEENLVVDQEEQLETKLKPEKAKSKKKLEAPLEAA